MLDALANRAGCYNATNQTSFTVHFGVSQGVNNKTYVTLQLTSDCNVDNGLVEHANETHARIRTRPGRVYMLIRIKLERRSRPDDDHTTHLPIPHPSLRYADPQRQHESNP